jgi:hypothetical protein
VEWYRQGKLLIRPPELSGNPACSHLVANQEELGDGSNEFSLTQYLFYTRGIL